MINGALALRGGSKAGERELTASIGRRPAKELAGARDGAAS